MQIPGFRKKTTDSSVTDVVPVSKPLPLLVAVRFNRSRSLVVFYRFAYSVFALALLLVFCPFIIEQPAWLLLFACLCWGLWRAYGHSLAQEPTGSLAFTGGNWEDGRWLYDSASEHAPTSLQLAGPVLCWPWIIILPLRNPQTAKVITLPIFSDALTVSDNACLRRWLQACLIPKG